ncbi:MAG: hypothetical protein AAF211_30620 [Myxococcota bacterium]
MMRPSHRLDVLAVPLGADHAPVEALRQLLAELREDGVIDVRGGPGPASRRWMPEGFRGLRLDMPERITLYGNRQGGFRVYCPVENEPITAAFSYAYSEARRQARPDLETLNCPVCGGVHALGELPGRPPFHFARLALQTIDAEALRPAPAMVERLERIFGGVRWVGVRT